jgi:hypothetical protein
VRGRWREGGARSKRRLPTHALVHGAVVEGAVEQRVEEVVDGVEGHQRPERVGERGVGRRPLDAVGARGHEQQVVDEDDRAQLVENDEAHVGRVQHVQVLALDGDAARHRALAHVGHQHRQQLQARLDERREHDQVPERVRRHVPPGGHRAGGLGAFRLLFDTRDEAAASSELGG